MLDALSTSLLLRLLVTVAVITIVAAGMMWLYVRIPRRTYSSLTRYSLIADIPTEAFVIIGLFCITYCLLPDLSGLVSPPAHRLRLHTERIAIDA